MSNQHHSVIMTVNIDFKIDLKNEVDSALVNI